ncbi:MAG: hypothetical protein K0U59_10015 [Gammaproteobacteria bacterium]|nr:hypothetical protein [Gammaproteobacteria bacterium]
MLDYQEDQEAWVTFQANNQRLVDALSLASSAEGELVTEEILTNYEVEGIRNSYSFLSKNKLPL